MSAGGTEEALDLVRVLATAALVVLALLGPGIALRALLPRLARTGLGFLPLPGMLLLAAIGALAWALEGAVEPRVTSLAAVGIVFALLLAALPLARPRELLSREERRCLVVVGAVLGLAIARALWSGGPEGELYGETISRTLAVGDRSDSRISFILPQLVVHGAAPYGELASSLFAPYNFSSRGPLPGLAATPVVLGSGGSPPAGLPEQPWSPFDPQGFMAYRIAMMALACTAFVSLWDLIRRLAGMRAARLGLLLAATSPFLLQEVWFTWPKLLAASLALLAGICVIEARPLRAGLLVGLGYLMHPVALLALPALGLLALWPLRERVWRRPRLDRLALLAVGTGALLVVWRLLNGDHYSQEGFVEYLTQAGTDQGPGAVAWLEFRAKSVANTLVPMLLPFASADNAAINVVGGISPASIHFFFQYWTTLPFGLAIVFFPLLLASLWRAARRWPWPLLATVLVPFACFAIYWGASQTGMMREGLQAWALTLLVVLACQQRADGFPWLRSRAIRALLSLRAVEVPAIALGPALATGATPIGAEFALTDGVALAAMLGLAGYLGAAVWSEGAKASAASAPRHAAAASAATTEKDVPGRIGSR